MRISGIVLALLTVGFFCAGSVCGLSDLPRTFDDSLAVNYIDLDKSSPGNQQTVTVSPRDEIEGTIEFQRWSGSGNPGEVSQAFLLYSWSHLPPLAGEYTPLYNGMPGAYPGVTRVSDFSITAPNSPGIYYVWAYHGAYYSMESAINDIDEFPYPASDAIAEITVDDAASGAINVEKFVNPPGGVSNEVLFIIDVENVGDLAFSQINLIDTLPEGMSLGINNVPPNNEVTENEDGTTTITWSSSDGLDPGEKAPFIMSVLINDNADGELVNEIEVKGMTSEGFATASTTCKVTVSVTRSGFLPSTNGFKFENPTVIRQHFNIITDEGASCLGMSACALMYYLIKIPQDAFSPFCNICGDKLPPYPCKSSHYIKELHVIMNSFGYVMWSYVDFFITDFNRMDLDYQFIRNCLMNDVPVVLSLGPDNRHAVVAYKVVEYTSKDIYGKQIYVYDPNEAGVNDRCIVLNVKDEKVYIPGGAQTKFISFIPNREKSEDGNIRNQVIVHMWELNDKVLDTIQIDARSPVDLVITDPQGLTISKEFFEIDDAYYIEGYFDDDDDVDDSVLILNRTVGNYSIKVVPEPGADPGDIYTLLFWTNGNTITLAEDVKIKDVPDHPYVVEVTENGNIIFHGYPDISVDKAPKPIEGTAPPEINFTINVSNSGSMPLTSIEVVDTLPEGLDYKSSHPAGTPAGKKVIWNLGPLAPGSLTQLYLTAQINDDDFETLTNIVNATGIPEVGDPVTDNYTCTCFEANITVRKNSNVSKAVPSSFVNFAIEVENNGYADFVSVVVEDLFPEGLDYVSNDLGTEPILEGDKRVWDLGSLDSGEIISFNVTARINGGDSKKLVNVANATGWTSYGYHVSSSCTAEIMVPGLDVEKIASEKKVKRGEVIEYTITIHNEADTPVYDVEVRDVFDRQVEFVSASPDPDRDGVWRFDMIPGNGSVEIVLVVRVPKQEFEFQMEHLASGVGFVNVADDYSTTLMPYVIKNRVSVTSANTYGPFSDLESVTVSEDPGTELSTREHGSGTYDSEERLAIRTENKSISMDKDVSATYAPTTLGLYRDRSVAYSSKWTEASSAKNRATGASMSESYRYSTRIDHESSMNLDENGSTLETETEFEGMGHIGTLKTSKNQVSPSFEAHEDYTGSFRIYEKVDEYGSGLESDKSVSGTGFVASEKRVRESQRTYESGTGTYESEEQIRTGTNYIAKDINVTYQPSSFTLLGEDFEVSQSLKWKEGVQSKTRGVSYIGEEFSGADRLDKETVARGLNEMVTDVTFSGMGRFRVILDGILNMDEEYQGDYSLQRNVLLHGVPHYDHPHMVAKKEGRIMPNTTLALYNITLENDGNKVLAPVYVKDIFPPLATFVNSSFRPSELTQKSANWTLTHLAIGDTLTIQLCLNVSEYSGDEIVNCVEVSGGYDGKWVTARNFTALEVNWLTCCLDDTISVTKTGIVDAEDPNVVWYQIDIHNGENSTKVAEVTDNLPEGMILIDSMIPFASYKDDTVTWNLIDIGPYETKTIAYRVEALHPGRFVNSVKVDPRSVDGSVEQPVYANCVVELGQVGDRRTDSSWQPPDWNFEYVGYSAETTCDEICSTC